jgi:ABC-type nitrate/sulfonate/bicarbonate transport system substrate-binding protein
MPVKLALDWTPNTNHTGIYVAQELGYFAEEGLQVEIVQPGPTTSIQLTGTGKVEFGVSMQEYVTMARSQNVPVVSIAAVIQHNTSGFAALKEKNIQTALDFEHKRYGGWGSALEEAMIQTAMGVAGADFTTVTQVNIGMVDFTTAATRDLADFFWIFYGWEGIHAELEALDFTFIPLIDISDIFDYYTPIIISSEGLIDQNPDLVRRFLRALSKGYQYAIDAPVGAAEILLKHVPELDQELVRVSQAWLAGKYAEGAEIWGVQCHETWQRFMEWAVGSGLIETEIDVDRAFTNAFLPQASDD